MQCREKKSVKSPQGGKGYKISWCPGRQQKMYLEANLYEEDYIYGVPTEEASKRLCLCTPKHVRMIIPQPLTLLLCLQQWSIALRRTQASRHCCFLRSSRITVPVIYCCQGKDGGKLQQADTWITIFKKRKKGKILLASCIEVIEAKSSPRSL